MSVRAAGAAVTRRGALGAGLAIVAGGSPLGPLPAARAAAAPKVPSVRRLLTRALTLEELSAFGAGSVGSRFAFDRSEQRLLRRIAGHDHQHIRRLHAELARLPLAEAPRSRSRAPGPIRDVAAADRVLATTGSDGSLRHLGDRKAALELLLRVKYSLEGAWYDLVAAPEDPRLAGMAAAALAVEAQHVAVLRRLHQPDYLEGAVPNAFVVGPR